MPDYDDARFGSRDGNVESVRIIREACIACCIGPDETDDHDVCLLSLCCVDGADSHLLGLRQVKFRASKLC